MKKFELTKDTLFHNRIDKMDLEQQCMYDTMLNISHFINCALKDDRERATGKCIPMQFSEFLRKIKLSYEATLKQQQECNRIIVFDDFIRIAAYSYEAAKEIVKAPSTHIEKIQTKILAQKATGFGTKTMKWMSQRPGRTIEEKISPENKVLTSKTVFSADTKENREFMYLYRILHEAIAVRVQHTKCAKCKIEEGCLYRDWILKVQRLLAMNLKIKMGELHSVKPIKQSFQNNKLMCDKNYKIVWDSVKMLSEIEDKIERDFNKDLQRRLSLILYWIILSELVDADGVLIEDYVGKVFDDEINGLWFGNKPNNDKILSIKTRIIRIDDTHKFNDMFFFAVNGSRITLADSSNKVLFEYDVEEYFASLRDAVYEAYISVPNETEDSLTNSEDQENKDE